MDFVGTVGTSGEVDGNGELLVGEEGTKKPPNSPRAEGETTGFPKADGATVSGTRGRTGEALLFGCGGDETGAVVPDGGVEPGGCAGGEVRSMRSRTLCP